MSRSDKLLERLIAKPKFFTYDELKKLLKGLGFKLDDKGKTSGLRVAFYHEQSMVIIRLHKPHPNNELKVYQINEVIRVLKGMGVI